MKKKRAVLLGATGSIGSTALDVIRANPDKLELVGAACRKNVEELGAIAREFSLKEVSLFDEEAFLVGQNRELFEKGTTLSNGLKGLERLATLPEADIVLMAIVGVAGLRPSIKALRAGKTLALASKEILVMAGEFVMAAAKESGSKILPVDSEHNAIYQCLEGATRDQVERITLTASGGPFLGRPREELETVTVAEALNHPNWSMGPKVTIDSATMANKGLELIEARWLFDMPPERIDVVIHPQSIAHSMAQFKDGSTLAQLSPPSMAFAIQHALLHPERGGPPAEPLDFSRPMKLDFLPPDEDAFPCLRLAREAIQAGDASPAVFNAANESAVTAFIANRIGFLAIPEIIAKTMKEVGPAIANSLEDALEIHALARKLARKLIDQA